MWLLLLWLLPWSWEFGTGSLKGKLSLCCDVLSASEKSKYELLCKDNTRAPIDNYEACHLAKVSAHAVVTRKDPQLADLIWNSLNSVKVKTQIPPQMCGLLFIQVKEQDVVNLLKKLTTE